MPRQGAKVSLVFEGDEYDAVKTAVRQGTRVQTREGITIRSSDIEEWVNRIVEEEIADHLDDDPLSGASVDSDDLDSLTDEQKQALGEALLK